MASKESSETNTIRPNTKIDYKETLDIMTELTATINKARELLGTLLLDKHAEHTNPQMIKLYMTRLMDFAHFVGTEAGRLSDMQKAKLLNEMIMYAANGNQEESLRAHKEYNALMERLIAERKASWYGQAAVEEFTVYNPPRKARFGAKVDNSDGAKPKDTVSKSLPAKDTDTESWEELEKLNSDVEGLELEGEKKQEKALKGKGREI